MKSVESIAKNLKNKKIILRLDLNVPIKNGKITDKSSGEELIGAAIFVLGTNNGSITDFEGNYELSNIESGPKKIICQYISYQNDTIEVNINQNLKLNFELISDSYTISAVELITKVDRKDESYVVNVQKKSCRND